MSQEERIHGLREMLSDKPSVMLWRKLWLEVEQWPKSAQHAESLEQTYLREHLSTSLWHDELKILTSKGTSLWLEGKSHPMFEHVRAYELPQYPQATLKELLQSPHTHQIRSLKTSGTYTPADQLRTQLQHLAPRQLHTLRWHASALRAEQLLVLLASESTQGLQTLDLKGNHLKKKALENIWQYGPSSLRALDLSHNPIGADDVEKLLSHDRWTQLRSLSLRHCALEGEAKGLAPEKPTVLQLQKLDLAYNQLGAQAVQQLLDSCVSHSLTDLVLDGNPIGEKGALALAVHPIKQQLQSLGLRATDLGEDGVVTLTAEGAAWPRLQELDLSFNGVDLSLHERLHHHPAWPNATLTILPQAHSLSEEEAARENTPQDQPLSLRACGVTEFGPVREHNEDAYAYNHERQIFVVADGMSGSGTGDIASQSLCMTLANGLQGEEHVFGEGTPGGHLIESALTRLQAATKAPFQITESRIYRDLQQLNIIMNSLYIPGMSPGYRYDSSTTFAAISTTKRRLLLWHIGADRIYRWRQGTLQQLTTDHTLLNELRKYREPTKEELEHKHYQNILTKLIGHKEYTEPEAYSIDTRAGDVFLLASDGLHKHIDETLMATIMGSCHTVTEDANPHQNNSTDLPTPSTEELRQAIDAMIGHANHNSQDNITALLVHILS